MTTEMTDERISEIQRRVKLLYATCVPFLTEEENNSFALLSRTDVPALCTAYEGAMRLLVELRNTGSLTGYGSHLVNAYLRKHGYIPKECDES